jgi:subtilase family serine protease
VAVSGTVAQAQRAFGLTIGRIRALGSVVNAPLQRARVPGALAGIVAGVRGLDGGDLAQARSLLPPPAYATPGPCSSYFGELAAGDAPGALGQPGPFPAVPCGYTPQQLRSAYGLDPAYAPGIDGRGVKVAIIDPFDSPRAKQDADIYSARHGLPPVDLTRIADPFATAIPNLPTLPNALAKLPPVALVTGLIDPDGASEEETLDIEAIHALAPGASIVYEASDSLLNISLLIAQNDVVDHVRARIVSNSYGTSVDAHDPMEDAILQQAAAEGIGFCFSSGDAGDETRDPNGPGDRETNAPANNPLATSVGGTSMAIGADGKAAWQTYWAPSPRRSSMARGLRCRPATSTRGVAAARASPTPSPATRRGSSRTTSRTTGSGSAPRRVPPRPPCCPSPASPSRRRCRAASSRTSRCSAIRTPAWSSATRRTSRHTAIRCTSSSRPTTCTTASSASVERASAHRCSPR